MQKNVLQQNKNIFMKKKSLLVALPIWFLLSTIGTYLKITDPKNSIATFLLAASLIMWVLFLALIFIQIIKQNNSKTF